MQKVTRSEFDLLVALGFDNQYTQSHQNMRGLHVVMAKNKDTTRIMLLEENTNGYYLIQEDANLSEAFSFLKAC